MRVTNQMMSKSFLRNLNKSQTHMKTINNQLTSGKEISRPSDNPYKVARSMQISSDIKAATQYNENIKDTSNWLDTTDTALQQVEGSFQRIRELMVSAGSASYGVDEKRAIKDEINEKINEIAQVLNTTFDGKYIFGGTKVNSKPVISENNGVDNEINYVDNLGNKITDLNDNKFLKQIGSSLDVEVSQGVTMKYNVSANEVLNFDDKNGKSMDVIGLLNDITKNLDVNGNVTDLLGDNLKDVDATISNLLKLTSEVGAKQNRMESALEQNDEQIYNLKDILSKTEDIDFAEKTMEMTVAQTIYTAALQVSASVIQPTLLDFL